MEERNIVVSTIEHAIEGLKSLRDSIGSEITEIVDCIAESNSRLVITGIGKSALIARKMVATMNSTGTPSIFMHAADALHGDLGMVQPDDIVICISRSGNSPEIKSLLPTLKHAAKAVIAMTADEESFLAKSSDYILKTPVDSEADPLNLAPTTSSTVQIVLGDALAIALMARKGFNSEDFARVHPGGALGKRLHLRVKDLIDSEESPCVRYDSAMEQVIVEISSKRKGATAVVNERGELVGIITDGDLRRALVAMENLKEHKAEDIMSANPKSISSESLAIDALHHMTENKISQLIVRDDAGKYIGLVHVHQLLKEGLRN